MYGPLGVLWVSLSACFYLCLARTRHRLRRQLLSRPPHSRRSDGRLFTLQPEIMSLSLQIFQLLRLGALVLTSIVLAKSGLSTEEIGRYEMLMYMGTVMTLFWVIGLLQGIVPVYSRLEEGERRAFIFNQFLVFCALSLGLFGVLFFGKAWVLPLLTGVSHLPHYGVFCLFLLLNLPSFPVEYLYLLREQPRHIVGWGVVIFGLQVLAVWWPLQAGAGLGGSLAALAVLGGVKFVWTLGLVAHRGQATVRPDLIWHYLSFSWPLVLAVLVGNIIVLFDNWLVGWYYADEAVFALYRYGSRELPLATALATALGTAMIPRLTADLAAGMQELKVRSRRVMHLIFPLTAGLLFFTKPLFVLAFNADLAQAAPIFNIYLLLTASRVLLPNALVVAIGEPGVTFRWGLAELVVKVVLGFLFLHWWGLPGIAWSVVLAYWVEKIGLTWYLYRRHGLRTGEWLDVRLYLGYVLLLAGAYLCSLFWVQ